MKAKRIMGAAGAATVVAVGAVLIGVLRNRSGDEVVLSPEVVTLEPTDLILPSEEVTLEATVEELPTVVVTLEPTELILTPEEVTLEATDEVLPPVVVTMEATEEVFDIYADPRGSCVAIAEGNTCLDYWGTYWTPETMQLHCNGTGTYVPEPCMTEDRLAGCRSGAGTEVEFVMWVYSIGPNSVDVPDFLAGCAELGGDPIP